MAVSGVKSLRLNRITAHSSHGRLRYFTATTKPVVGSGIKLFKGMVFERLSLANTVQIAH
jgi:hypothetical protein